ncbi:MAG: hypothetical protein U0325_01710 [Polyangiales bacterium]
MRPPPALCDWCRKIAVPGKTGAGALAFQGPDDVLVRHAVDGNSTRLIVRAEPAAGRAERIVFIAHIVIAVILLAGIAVKPSIALPILAVSVVVMLTGLWLSRVSGARSEFVVDGATFTARGWRGGSINTSPRDVRDIRIDGKGPSVEHNRPRTAYDIAFSLDDGTTHVVKAQFLRHEYAEMTLAHLRDAVDRASQR